MIRTPATNNAFAIGGVSWSINCFVVTESSVLLRMSFGAEMPVKHRSANG